MVDAVVPPVAQVLSPVVDAVVPPVAQVLSPVVDAVVPPVAQVLSPVVDAVVPPVTQVLPPVVDAVVPPVTQVLSPVVESVVPPVTQVLSPVVDAVVRPVAQVLQPVVDGVVPPVAQVLTPVVERGASVGCRGCGSRCPFGARRPRERESRGRGCGGADGLDRPGRRSGRAVRRCGDRGAGSRWRPGPRLASGDVSAGGRRGARRPRRQRAHLAGTQRHPVGVGAGRPAV